MNKPEVIDFLKQFDIKDNIIDNFLKNKHIITVNNNTFLTTKKFEKNQIYGGTLLFIQLKEHLPSKFLLDFIKQNTKLAEIISEKQALNFTYGKDLKIGQVKYQQFNNKQLYIVTHKDEILGYAKYYEKEFNNLMNIGEYLKES